MLPNMPAGAGPRAFVDKIWPEAVEASKATGIPARFLVAQAALETGWGKFELKNADGSASHNLFNIKGGTNLADVVKALNAVGANPLELISILQAMKASGALRAELEVI